MSASEKSRVETLTVTGDEAELRLDRWFRRRFPALGHGRLEKLLRTGQVRVDGKRGEAQFDAYPDESLEAWHRRHGLLAHD